MGYETKYSGLLKFNRELTFDEKKFVSQFFDNTSLSMFNNANWGTGYIRLKFSQNSKGLVWNKNGSLCNMKNSIEFFQAKLKDLGLYLEGEIIEEGDMIEDKWKIKVEKGSVKKTNLRSYIGKRCPHCNRELD